MKKRLYQYSVALFLLLVSLHLPALPQNRNDSWSRRYRQVTGNYDLIIDQVESDMIEVTILKAQDPGPYASAIFLATIKNDIATMKLLKNEPDCQMELKRVEDDIVVSDFCGGRGDEVGQYDRIY